MGVHAFQAKTISLTSNNTALMQTPPQSRRLQCCGRYASYWTAFLSHNKFAIYVFEVENVMHYQQRYRSKLVLTPSLTTKAVGFWRVRLFRYSEHAKKSLNQGSKERGDESSERLIYDGFNTSTSQVVLYGVGGGLEPGVDLCKINRYSIQFNCIWTKCNNSNRKTLA